MKPRSRPRDAFELFQAHFDQMLDPDHELILLANQIYWPSLDVAFADCYRPDIGAPVMAGRYAHAKQFKRMRRQLRKLRTYVGRLIRDIRRKATDIDEEPAILLDRTDRIRCQQPKDKKKLYSLHESEVQCISKGKAHKRYEFGRKIAVATTNRSNWFVASRLCENNPYDGHALSKTLATVESVTGVAVTDVYVDKGYRGPGYAGGAEVHIAGQRRTNMSRAQGKRGRRRSAIEPKIGHLKSDHRMGRCFLARLCGDAINAVPASAGSNLRKLLGLLRRDRRRLFFALCEFFPRLISPLICRIRSLPRPYGGTIVPVL